MFSNMLMSNKVVTPTGVFTPASLPNLVSWYRAQDEPLGVMSSWTDLSGNGHNITQTIASRKPTNLAAQINGKSAVQASGSGPGALLQAAFPLVQPEEVYLVFKRDVWSNYKYAFDGYTEYTMTIRSLTIPSFQIRSGGTGIYTNPLVNSWMLGRYLFSGANSEVQINNAATMYPAGVGTVPADGFTLFNKSQYWSGQPMSVAEVFILSAPATAAENANITNYINAQYALGI